MSTLPQAIYLGLILNMFEDQGVECRLNFSDAASDIHGAPFDLLQYRRAGGWEALSAQACKEIVRSTLTQAVQELPYFPKWTTDATRNRVVDVVARHYNFACFPENPSPQGMMSLSYVKEAIDKEGLEYEVGSAPESHLRIRVDKQNDIWLIVKEKDCPVIINEAHQNWDRARDEKREKTREFTTRG